MRLTVLQAGFVPAFTLSQGNSERFRKPPIASVVIEKKKQTLALYK